MNSEQAVSAPEKMSVRRWLEVLGARLSQHRLNRNLTQAALARDAGVSVRTLVRAEHGEPVHLESFVRILAALGMQGGLDRLVPEVPESPIQRLERAGTRRERATGKRPAGKRGAARRAAPWRWADRPSDDPSGS